MKISVITVVYNNEKYIKDCIDSVNSQTYQDIEHIIVDGESTDKTLKIIKENNNPKIRLISGIDLGIYDAMNKGVQLSTGEIIGFLNSDDIFYDENTVAKIANVFKKKDVDSCYGDLVYVDKSDTDKVIRNWKSNEFKISLLRKGWHPPHPTFYVRKKIFEKYGMYDLSYKIASDYALMVKLLFKERISNHYLTEIIVRMRMGGTSNRNIKNIILANYECYKSCKKIGLNVSPLLIIRKPFGKLFQFVDIYTILKRIFDVVLSLFGLTISFPLWIIIAALIKVEDNGAVFYKQQRVGLQGQEFTAYKFRTMIEDSDELYGPLQAKENDKRITRIGKILRSSAMDELPQLLSIFKGYMSFVGPRALSPNEIETNSKGKNLSIEDIPGYKERHTVVPGLTGIAQIYAPRDIKRQHKFRYDRLYIKKRSFFLDLRLIFLSFWITFKGTWESRDKKF